MDSFNSLFLISGFFLLLTTFSVTIFIILHTRPLKEDEIIQLADKQRQKLINQYFSFDQREFFANTEFKKRMNPSGEFQIVNESLVVFPAIAAALLKYKKHEWIIIAFEKGGIVNKLWINKGINRSQVSIYLSPEFIARLADADDDISILIFHNHPNSDPTLFDLTHPSNQDITSAHAYALILNQEGKNLLEFVCERGRHYRYFQSITPSFFPLSRYIASIKSVNDISFEKNLKLHLERLF